MRIKIQVQGCTHKRSRTHEFESCPICKWVREFESCPICEWIHDLLRVHHYNCILTHVPYLVCVCVCVCVCFESCTRAIFRMSMCVCARVCVRECVCCRVRLKRKKIHELYPLHIPYSIIDISRHELTGPRETGSALASTLIFTTPVNHMWDVTHSDAGHDSFIRGSWLVQIWEKTLPMCGMHVWHATSTLIFTTPINDMWDVTHSHDGSDSFIRGTWLIYIWDMTHLHMGHDSFTYGTWLIYIWDMTHLHMGHVSRRNVLCVTTYWCLECLTQKKRKCVWDTNEWVWIDICVFIIYRQTQMYECMCKNMNIYMCVPEYLGICTYYVHTHIYTYI